jgi:hypothetical protein
VKEAIVESLLRDRKCFHCGLVASRRGDDLVLEHAHCEVAKATGIPTTIISAHHFVAAPTYQKPG